MSYIYFQVRRWGRWTKRLVEDPSFPTSFTCVGAYKTKEGDDSIYKDGDAKAEDFNPQCFAEEYLPDDTYPDLHLIFMLEVKDRDSALKFVNQFGFLGLPTVTTNTRDWDCRSRDAHY